MRVEGLGFGFEFWGFLNLEIAVVVAEHEAFVVE